MVFGKKSQPSVSQTGQAFCSAIGLCCIPLLQAHPAIFGGCLIASGALGACYGLHKLYKYLNGNSNKQPNGQSQSQTSPTTNIHNQTV